MLNKMQMIEQWMDQNGFEVHTPYAKYSVTSGNNDICVVMIVPKEDGRFMIRSALLPLFDRWANSGSEVFVDSENDVIRYLESSYLYDAAKEIISDVMDRCDISNSHEPMFALIDWLIGGEDQTGNEICFDKWG